MVTEKEFLQFAAGILDVPPGTLSLETTYGSIPQWDSMAQLRLVMEIATTYHVEIPFADVVNVSSLWEFLRRINGGAVKKVVAVDFDNTLWDGVVGEDGREAIRPNLEFMRTLRGLRERGVLLVALSKNNPADVDWFLSPSADATPLPLSGEDFVATEINWRPKAENLLAVAKELNLGADSFVFVDDNPAERLEMASLLPEVTVAAFPPNLDAYFPNRPLTDEDRHKTEEYRAEAQRKHVRAQLPEAADCSERLFDLLGVVLDIHELRGDEIPRVAQLSQKANQFNVCTNRRIEDEIRTLTANPANLIVTARARDRFGDQGLIAFVIVQGAEITDWTMSCRVMGRGIEVRIEREVERLVRPRGYSALSARWIASGKNVPVRDLFDRFGFSLISETEAERHYTRPL